MVGGLLPNESCVAPEGATWVCIGCGKTMNDTREAAPESCCASNMVLVKADSIKRREDGVIEAEAFST